jgi:DHA2 family multidrug resistance protein
LKGDGIKKDLLKQFDYIGIALIVIFLGSFQYVIGEGPDQYWFESSLLSTMVVVSGIGALLLLWRELSCRHPVINLRTFKDRNFSIGCLLNFWIGLGLTAQMYTTIIFLSSVKEFDSQQIGEVLSITGLIMVISVPLVRLSRRFIGARTCLACGLFMYGISLWINTTFNAEVGFYDLFLTQVPRGLSIMFCLPAITELALGRIPIETVPNASGLYTLMRSLGGGLGIGVINYLMAQRLALHYSRLAESLNPVTFYEYLEQIQVSFTDRMADIEHSRWGAEQVLGEIVRREAAVMVCIDMWLILLLLFGVMLILVPAVQRMNKR